MSRQATPCGTCRCAVSQPANACTAPVRVASTARPARVAAAASWLRCRGLGASSGAASAAMRSPVACQDSARDAGVDRPLQNDSTACASASNAAGYVTAGGHESVSRGSTIATSASTEGWSIARRCRPVPTAANRVISAPLPAVVGSSTSRGGLLRSVGRGFGSGSASTRPSFAVSSAEPPPRPTTTSGLDRWTSRTSSATCSQPGFGAHRVVPGHGGVAEQAQGGRAGHRAPAADQEHPLRPPPGQHLRQPVHRARAGQEQWAAGVDRGGHGSPLLGCFRRTAPTRTSVGDHGPSSSQPAVGSPAVTRVAAG